MLYKSFKRLFFSLLVLLISSSAFSETYYFNSITGNDNSDGLSRKKAWKSLQKANSFEFQAGDSVLFARGSEWLGRLEIRKSGTKEAPIIYTAYGEGGKPLIKNPNEKMGSCVRISAFWIIFENFLVSGAQDAGIYLADGAGNNIIRYNEVTSVGIGISIDGNHNLITENYIHDLEMVVNNPGGDNDYGAVGIWIGSFTGKGSPSFNELSYNKLIRCSALSQDYGKDGGAVEFYGDADNNYVHHNRAEECNGFFEVGGQGDTLSNNTIAYNLMINNGYAGSFHGGGKFGVTIENLRIDHNVIFELRTQEILIGFWAGEVPPEAVIYRNNIFYLPNYTKISNTSSFGHEYNIYYMGDKRDIGMELGKGELISNPCFVAIDKLDFHLLANSPAIDAGKDLKYKNDFDNQKVPIGNKPDIGAFEFIK